MNTLGSMFVAHPPIAPYIVSPTGSDHPLVAGIGPFEVLDELYLSEVYTPLEVLLDTGYEGCANSFVDDTWPKARHPVFYLRSLGDGAVLYLTLGHCRGHYDMQPRLDYYPKIERGSWELAVFHELLRRGLSWAKEPAS
jgi:type 1 glutamine amidotransferase